MFFYGLLCFIFRQSEAGNALGGDLRAALGRAKRVKAANLIIET